MPDYTLNEQADLRELATRWVEMAQTQQDLANEYHFPRAEGTAETLRMCALMLRELLDKRKFLT